MVDGIWDLVEYVAVTGIAWSHCQVSSKCTLFSTVCKEIYTQRCAIMQLQKSARNVRRPTETQDYKHGDLESNIPGIQHTGIHDIVALLCTPLVIPGLQVHATSPTLL